MYLRTYITSTRLGGRAKGDNRAAWVHTLHASRMCGGKLQPPVSGVHSTPRGARLVPDALKYRTRGWALFKPLAKRPPCRAAQAPPPRSHSKQCKKKLCRVRFFFYTPWKKNIVEEKNHYSTRRFCLGKESKQKKFRDLQFARYKSEICWSCCRSINYPPKRVLSPSFEACCQGRRHPYSD